MPTNVQQNIQSNQPNNTYNGNPGTIYNQSPNRVPMPQFNYGFSPDSGFGGVNMMGQNANLGRYVPPMATRDANNVYSWHGQGGYMYNLPGSYGADNAQSMWGIPNAPGPMNWIPAFMAPPIGAFQQGGRPSGLPPMPQMPGSGPQLPAPPMGGGTPIPQLPSNPLQPPQAGGAPVPQQPSPASPVPLPAFAGGGEGPSQQGGYSHGGGGIGGPRGTGGIGGSGSIGGPTGNSGTGRISTGGGNLPQTINFNGRPTTVPGSNSPVGNLPQTMNWNRNVGPVTQGNGGGFGETLRNMLPNFNDIKSIMKNPSARDMLMLMLGLV